MEAVSRRRPRPKSARGVFRIVCTDRGQHPPHTLAEYSLIDPAGFSLTFKNQDASPSANADHDVRIYLPHHDESMKPAHLWCGRCKRDVRLQASLLEQYLRADTGAMKKDMSAFSRYA